MSTSLAKPARVAIIGATGTYGSGILARAEEVGVEAVVVTRSPHKLQNVKPTTRVVEAQLDEEEKLKRAFAGCDGVISALGDDRSTRPKTHNLPHVWSAMKAAGVTKYVGTGSGPMMMPGETPGAFQRAVHALLSVLKLFGVDMLEQNEWERDSLLAGRNGADGLTWVLTRPVRPTRTPFAGAYARKDERGPLNCSIYDHGDFCLYCVASSEWDRLAPHVSSRETPLPKITIFWIKLVHTVIFWILSLCVLYALYSGIADRVTTWTWVAVVLLLLESVVLAVSGWTCPLTILAERQGAMRGSVTDIFLPKPLADRIFPVCGTLYGVALALIAWRLLR